MIDAAWQPKALTEFGRREIRWLWRPFIPFSFITTVAGDGEVGKTTAVYDILARLTTGDPMPRIGDEPELLHQPGSIVILCKEDDPGYMIRPRLEAAGADMDHVHMVVVERRGSRKDQGVELLGRLDNTLVDLERIICQLGDVRAVLADPITDFAGDISLYKEDQVRRLLGPIAQLASKYGFAWVNILHLIKDGSKKPRQRILGSVGLVNISRSVIMVGKSAVTGRRFLMMEKANLWPERKAVAFEIGSYSGQPVVDWEGDYEEVDLEAVLAGKSAHVTKQQQAVLFLQKWLAEGAMSSKDVEAAAEDIGISFATFKAAKREAGVVAKRLRGIWWWQIERPGGL
ncbi:AAA family ATPase [Bradyrhizobium sp. 4]|uniref:AAA family ATPase n=1 Tax=unclassified Bradyrhizobium TaxID=2631580 RepID=UPI001FF8EC30|nr:MULTISPECIES: AAA family ATPase [unclassified Bradyrhizobium]MCK1403589.1 AAA family ATPase [Bradyrhizobium sp. 39]MCK1746784.1 AAA family ATPase [Bradyrhizobium sp. 135]UPJ35715.1 AAA family ATPase [Bradyrhizobium sp. 4]